MSFYSGLIEPLEQFENTLEEFNAHHDQQIAMYGIRDRYDELKEKAKSAFSSMRNSLGEFFKRLTDGSAGPLPEWVYTASEGALQSMLDYLAEHYGGSDEHSTKVALEMLRHGVAALRKRITEAAKKAAEIEENKKDTETEVEGKEKEKEKENENEDGADKRGEY